MQFKNQNITEAKERYIIHGCNAQGVYNAGVAKDIREKWPEAYSAYMSMFKYGAGTVPLTWHSSRRTKQGDQTIINLITQVEYGTKGRYASPAAIAIGLDKICNMIKPEMAVEDTVFAAVPKIGCGYGGLSFETDVKPIYELLEALYNIEFVVYDTEKFND
jgi:O-acetyl-ADP-ribose deacetylase (regulator of RNase III)